VYVCVFALCLLVLYVFRLCCCLGVIAFVAETLELPWLWRCGEVILCVGSVRSMHVLGTANVGRAFVMSCVVFCFLGFLVFVSS